MARSWLIGSSADCDEILPRPNVAGHHCRLTREGNGISLEDLGSAEGTFVNGVRITMPTRVTPGDAVTLGLAVPMPWPAEAIPPGWQIVQIGRDLENDVAVSLPMVSGAHARLIWNGETHQAIIEDLGSANGTAVGSPDRKVSRSVVASTDTVYLGTHPVPASDLLARLTPAHRPALTFRGEEMTIGRDPSCDLVIELPMISGRHARLARSGSLTLIEDLGSANGTSVNGQRIDRAVAVKAGDLIGLGSYLLKLRIDEPEAPAPELVETLNELASPESGIPQFSPRIPSQTWRLPVFVLVAVAGLVVAILLLSLGGPPREVAARANSNLAAVPETDPAADSAPSPGPPTPDPPVKPIPASPSPDLEPSPKASYKPEPPDSKPAPPRVYDLVRLTPDDEAKLGRELNALIRRYHPAVDAGPLLQRLRAAEESLIARGGRKVRYTYTILDSDEVNAFSHVGGFIYLSWGLFALIASEEELQFVLAHELAHLDQKHALQSLAADTEEGEPAAQPAPGTAQRIYRQIAKGYAENLELEADDLALKAMRAIGHSRRRCLAFLRKYQEYASDRGFVNGHNPPRSGPADPAQDVANHFGAHPAAWERLKRLEAVFDRVQPMPKPATSR